MAQINKPTDYFNTKLYTGTGTTQAITGVGFQPDFTWIKQRDGATARHHRLVDSVRGATKYLESDRNIAEVTDSTQVTSLDSDGFTVGTGNATNSNTVNFAAWNWLGGGTASSNTDGSITSQVSANTTSGFSIVTYTGNGTAGATVGHGLGSTPKVVIVKVRNTANEWVMYHASLGATKFIEMNSTGAVQTSSTRFNDTAPTSSVFSLGTAAGLNTSSDTHVAYCFAEKKGFSKFGSYVGNGGNQFIYTGFKPAFVIEKRSSNASEWDMYDNKRNTYNSVTKVLKPNASDAEATYGGLNFLSNGFEAKGSLNDSGQTLIYMAFAENPLVGTNNIPSTAR